MRMTKYGLQQLFECMRKPFISRAERDRAPIFRSLCALESHAPRWVPQGPSHGSLIAVGTSGPRSRGEKQRANLLATTELVLAQSGREASR